MSFWKLNSDQMEDSDMQIILIIKVICAYEKNVYLLLSNLFFTSIC